MNRSLVSNYKIARVTVMLLAMQIFTCLLPTIDVYKTVTSYYSDPEKVFSGSFSIWSSLAEAIRRISVGEENASLVVLKSYSMQTQCIFIYK